MKTVLLTDGDIIAFKAALGHNKDGETVSTEAEAIECVEQHLKWLREFLFADEVRIYLSDPKANFRKDIYAHYKGNRKPEERPPLIDIMKTYLREAYGAWHAPRLEADDLMGIFMTEPQTAERRIMVSLDKDMKTVPGELFNDYNGTTAALGVQDVTPEGAWLYLWEQALSGDTTDNYPGIPGVGPKKAQKIIAEGLKKYSPQKLWPTIREAFIAKGLTEADAVVQVNCARILHWGDYDFDTGTIHLYQPPSIELTLPEPEGAY